MWTQRVVEIGEFEELETLRAVCFCVVANKIVSLGQGQQVGLQRGESSDLPLFFVLQPVLRFLNIYQRALNYEKTIGLIGFWFIRFSAWWLPEFRRE